MAYQKTFRPDPLITLALSTEQIDRKVVKKFSRSTCESLAEAFVPQYNFCFELLDTLV